MLDVKIPELRKLKLSQAKALLEKHVTVFEKFDGTKLTLIRDNNSRRENSCQGWIVAYKGNVISPNEVHSVTNEQMENSVGLMQYKRIFDHLRSLSLESDIPNGTELFIEFIQNKPTLTRDYLQFGDMYLIGHAQCEFIKLGMRVYTSSEKLETRRNAEFASLLHLKTAPVLFEGKLSSLAKSVDDVVATYSSYVSSLGGQAEGVVIVDDDGNMTKVVAADQYDKSVRKAKKMRYALEEPFESDYWRSIKTQASQLVNYHWTDDTNFFLRSLSEDIFSLSSNEIVAKNPKKHLSVVQDDLMLTAKLTLESALEIRGQEIGIIPMAGRPVHDGHWRLIENALKECSTVYLFVSANGRGEGLERIEASQMFWVWKELLLPKLDPRVIVRFVESPLVEAHRFVKNLTSSAELGKFLFRFYGDEKDVEERWSGDSLKKLFPELFDKGFVSAKGFDRASTVPVSATEMRKYLVENKYTQFCDRLPSVLSKADKKRYLEVLIAKG